MEKEHLKGAAYTAISMKTAVENGWFEFEYAKQIVLRWMNAGLSNGELHDVKKYFDPSVYSTSGDTPEWVGKELSTEAWKAFEFFGII